jgi:uncharacterized RDD family membrane protein YckC
MAHPTQQPGPSVAWQAPTEVAGPAPGVEWAGFGERLVAYIVDGLILGAIFVALSVFLIAGIIAGIDISDPRNPELSGGAIAAVLLWLLAIFVVSLVYFPFFWVNGGQTPGMRLFGIRVVRDLDGGPVGWGSAFLRLIGYWVAGVVFYIGYVWIFFDTRRRGWHDLIAGTVVVKAVGR